MNEEYLHLPNGAQVRLTLGDVGVMPGVGKHRLYIQASLSPASEQADNTTLSLTGDANVENLGAGGGFIGTIIPSAPETIRRDGTRQITLTVELTEDQIRRIEAHRVSPDGAFSIRLSLRVSLADAHGTTFNTGSPQPVRVSRETWTNILEQVGYRKVLIAELPVPDGATKPALSQALDFYRQAQTRFSNGDFRGTAEALRQSLAAVVGRRGDEEVDVDAVIIDFRDAQKQSRDDRIGYPERMELVRAALKFTADLGAHPEVADTQKAEALAQLHMVAGLIQWYSQA